MIDLISLRSNLINCDVKKHKQLKIWGKAQRESALHRKSG